MIQHVRQAPECVTLQTFRWYCRDWSLAPSDINEVRNSIQSAVITEERLIHNTNDIMPPQYNADMLVQFDFPFPTDNGVT